MPSNKVARNLHSKFDFERITFNLFLLLLATLMLLLVLIIKSKSATEFFSDPLLLIYTIFVTSFQLSRIIGAMFFKFSLSRVFSSNKGITNIENYEPKVSFVIPCKNEEKSIAKTITKCFEVDYPQNKVDVIVINDGSTDNTINILRQVQQEYPKLIVVDWKKNKGKRHGMAKGFKLAKGEIVVQLDSDSYIEPKTFRNLIKPFSNPVIGAVCAHADPENRDENFLTKVQAAYYFVSFRILKAAESTFMSVFCCSGCSSAYRKSVVLPIMDTWLNEKFLGLPVTWGDDRALTNWVLKLGYKTIYTDEVQAYTICPNKWKTFLKQQVRWKKGWFVNSLKASRFIYKKQAFVAVTYFFPLMLVTLITPFMAVRALIYNPFFRGISPIYYILGVFSMSTLVVLYYRYISKENKYWKYVFAWSAINMIVLSFVLFYALIRLQDRK